MTQVIIDCYTDEPAGLGVPPYLGTYPRYLYGYLKSMSVKSITQDDKNPENSTDDNGNDIFYLTIDDLRLFLRYHNKKPVTLMHEKTNIRIHNLTKNSKNIKDILLNADDIYFVLGVHVPGKYLTAEPGTLRELNMILPELCRKFDLCARKILTGPAATEFGTRSEGGKFAEKQDLSMFDEVNPNIVDNYDEIAKFAVEGSEIVAQIANPEGWNYIIAEIETGRGCKKSVACSFCTEPLKHKLEFRKINDIVDEVKALNRQGIRYFRLGKQSDFFSWSEKDIEEMLSKIRKECSADKVHCADEGDEDSRNAGKGNGIDVLHIDNIDPVNVTEEKVRLVVKYCTPGNVAALGAETFDKDVAKANNLNSSPEMTMKAIRILNKYGAERGGGASEGKEKYNGMPKFLPGINIILGLIGEGKKTHAENMAHFQKILDENLLLRRINIRQVAIFPGTQIEKECGNKFLRKNKRYYWKWRDEIRQKIDNEMLKRLVPVGTVLKDCIAEIYDGKTTFLRQIGTYPLIIGVKAKPDVKKGEESSTEEKNAKERSAKEISANDNRKTGGRLELGKFYDIKVTGYMLRSIVGEVVE